MAKKRRWKFQITLIDHDGKLVANTEASSSSAACRNVFKEWIRDGLIKRPPRNTAEGGFEGVRVEVLGRVA